jgi:hypothetical protein
MSKIGPGVSSTPNLREENRPKPLRTNILQDTLDTKQGQMISQRNITSLNGTGKRVFVPHRFVAVDNADRLIQESENRIN